MCLTRQTMAMASAGNNKRPQYPPPQAVRAAAIRTSLFLAFMMFVALAGISFVACDMLSPFSSSSSSSSGTENQSTNTNTGTTTSTSTSTNAHSNANIDANTNAKLALASHDATTGTNIISTDIADIANANATLAPRQAQEITPTSPCSGSEGLWNCMTTSFQRCGSGEWSVVQQCALGTKCWPQGLTYQFYVDYADGYLGAAPPPPNSSPSQSGQDPAPTTSGGWKGMDLGMGMGLGMGFVKWCVAAASGGVVGATMMLMAVMGFGLL